MKKIIRLTAFTLLLCAQYANSQIVNCPPNIDFSFGNFADWSCYTGTSQSSAPAGMLPAFANAVNSGPVSNRHQITTGTGVDPYGGFAVIAPGGGLFSMKLGNSNTGSGAERIRYFVHVPAGVNNYSLNYKCAVVLNDSGHAAYNRPAFTVIGYDSATGNPLPCATHIYAVNDAGSPGFFYSPINSNVHYLSWVNRILNLSGQAGKTITVEVTSYDCADGAHFGYGYFDLIGCDKFQPAITYCDRDAGVATLSAPPGYANYKWYKGPVISALYASSSSPITNIPLIPAVPVFYYCVLTPFGNSGCPDTIRTRTITDFSMNALPDFICNQRVDPVQLDLVASPPSGGYSYSWVGNTALSCNKCQRPFVLPIGPVFFIGIVADSIGCFRKDTVREGHSNIKLSLGGDTTICLGSPVTLKPALTPASGNYIFTWTGVHAGTTLSDTTILNPVYTSTKAGLDMLTLRVDSSACSVADTILIRTPPNDFHAADTAVCQYAIFYPEVSGDTSLTYTWTPSTGLQPGQIHLQSPQIMADTTRTYTVSATNAFCPDIVKTVTVRVEPLPVVDIGADTLYKCRFTPLRINAMVTPSWFTGYSYEWLYNDGIDDVHAAQISFSGDVDTTLVVAVTTPLGCTGVDAVRIQMYDSVFVSLSDSAILLPGASYQLHAVGNALHYTWSPVAGLDNSNVPNPVANPSVNTRYIVTATSGYGCVATDSILVVLPYDDTQIDMPNAFTPGSINNPEFKVSHIGKATLRYFRVYDRWGNKVFETTDINNGWNGRFNGELQPLGVYTYVVSAITNKGKTFYKQGNVTLIR